MTDNFREHKKTKKNKQTKKQNAMKISQIYK
jgi:hypothetical protein